MHEHLAPHRVRAARRGHGLTLNHMASLLGYRSDDHVSRVERGLRPPSIRFLIGSTIVFGRSIEDLFKSLYELVEEHVAREAYLIHERLTQDPSPSAAKCRELLAPIISRAAQRHQTNQSYEETNLS